MRKYLLILVLIFICIVCFSLMTFGLKFGDFNLISSFKDVTAISTEKEQLVTELKAKNSTEFMTKNAALTTAVQEYKNKKSQYEQLVQAGQITDSDIYNSMDLYEVDFLWATIGNYATENNLTLQFDITKSTSIAAVSADYAMCDLNFTVTGEYIAITDFLYDIENNDKLGFEISNFVMEKGGENLQATFVVKGVPINNRSLSSVPTTTTSSYTELTTGN